MQINGKKFWSEKDFQYNAFLVFGPGIYPEDMAWDEPFLLRNQKTGDSIKFTESSRCNHLVFYEEGEIKPFTWLRFYNKL